MTRNVRLEILPAHHDATAADLVRLFHRTQLHWVRHLGEETQLDTGVAFTNSELAGIPDANGIVDAALPHDSTPAQAVEEARLHFEQAGTACRQWLFNPGAPESQMKPLLDFLEDSGWRAHRFDVMRLGRRQEILPDAPGLTIIPARASFRHAQELAEEEARECGVPQIADASMAHLDDPHWDVAIAVRDGRAVARAGVLAVGEIGRVDHLFVAPPYRLQGIGRTMMNRVLDVCARSLFKHVMLRVRPDEDAAAALSSRLGFHRIGELVAYRPPPLAS